MQSIYEQLKQDSEFDFAGIVLTNAITNYDLIVSN